MVFEALVVEFLNRFLKRYVENLDTSQLKIGIWGGDVVLHDLKIKSSILDEFNLPVAVKWGKLGKFAMKIPWKNLYSAQVVIDIEELLLIVVSNVECSYDPVKEEKRAQDKKLAKLKAVEEARKHELELDTAKQNDSFLEKLLTQITKNLQIIIRNIHIRYEDKTTIPNSPFSVGLTLAHLSARTTTKDPTKIVQHHAHESEHLICKLVQLDGLAIYWNSCTELFSDADETSLKTLMMSSIPAADHHPEDFMYMFGPLSASAFLRLNPKPEIDGSNFTIPKIFVNVHLKEIDLAVTHSQFKDVVTFLQDFQRQAAAAKFKKYRPVGVPVIGHAKTWWNFAYKSVMEDILRRRNEWCWMNIKDHRRKCRRYLELFRMKLHSKKMTVAETREYHELEKKLNIFNLILIREQVYVEYERSKESLKDIKPKGWFSGWFGGATESKTSDINDEELVKKLESVMTVQEKQKLYKAIGYEESAPPTNYPPTFIEVQFWFNLDEMKLTVYDDPILDSSPVMILSVKSVKLEFERRPSAFAMKFIMVIGNFQVTGKEEKDEKQPALVTSNCKETESLVEFVYETKPLDSSCDQRVIINARPLNVIFHASTVNLVRDIFSSEASGEMERIVAATSASLPTFRSITSMGLQYAIEKRTVLEVKVHIKSSYLIIPYGGVYRQDTDMLVLMLGSLSIESEKNITKDVSFKKLFIEGINDEEMFSAILSESYTKFKCRLTGVQILFQLKGEDWVAASSKPKSALQFLEPTNLEVTIKKSLVMDDARIPKMIVEGKLPSLTFNFSEERFVGFVALICSIPTKSDKHPPYKKASSVSSWSLQSFSTQLESKFIHRPSSASLRPQEYTQGIDLVGHFEMNELRVHVSKSVRSNVSGHSAEDMKGGSSEEQFLNLSLIKLEIELTSKTFETIHLLKLGGVDFKQHLKRAWLPLLAPKAMKQDYYLFVVEYINLDTRMPDFYSVRGGINNRLTFNITPVNVLLEKEALLAQVNFVKNVQRRIDYVKETSSGSRLLDTGRIKDLLEEGGENLQITSERKAISRGRRFRRKSQQEVIDFFLQVSLEEITVGVEFKDEGLTEFNLKGGNIDISHRKSYATLDVNIREVCVLDFNPQSKHKKILESLDNQTLSSRMTIYNKEYFGVDNAMDMSIDAELGGIQVTCLSVFCSRGVSFLEAFQTQVDHLKEGASMAAQRARKNVVKAFQNAAQICLNVKITAPILVIPRSSHSLDTLILDLGVLTIKNSIMELDYSLDGATASRPLIDTMKLHLHNLKVTRSPEYGTGEDERTFLVPVSFELTVKRNLSTAWFRVIPELEVLARLASIRVNLTHEDLCAIFTIIQDNLAEGERDKAERIASRKKLDPKYIAKQRASHITPRAPPPEEGEDVKKSSHFYTVVKFEFFMDSFIFDALNEKKDIYSSSTGLAQFVLEAMSVKGRLFSDGAINTSLMLSSCVLDDTRPGKEGKLTRLMERTMDPAVDSTDGGPAHCMIEVIYHKKDYDSFVDVRVYKFTLALSMEFLHKLGIFFTLKKDLEGTMGALESTREYHKAREKRILAAEESDRAPTFTINVRLEKPDIIFVENMDSIDTDALVFHTEMVMKYRFAGEKQIISGALRDIELYSCCFNPAKRPHTLSQVVKPFSVSVAGSTPENLGLHLDVCLTEIVISINPSTVDLISKCYEVLLKDTLIKQKSEENIFTDLWDIKPFSEDDYLFFKTEMGEDALKNLRRSVSSATFDVSDEVYEICLLAIPSITVYLEGISTSYSHPLLSLQMGYQMRCHNWSQRMAITNTLSLGIQYYNKTCSAWEPLLEPVEKYSDLNKPIHSPWELFCTIHFYEEGELEGLHPPKTQVTVFCEDTMQLTFTKTCLDILKVALDTYTTVVTKHVVKKETDLPPYVVKNWTGLVIELLLDESKLQVCKSPDPAKYTNVRLNSNSEVELENVIEASELYRNERRPTVKKGSGLYVKFPTLGNTVIRFPVGVSSKRYFPLPPGESSKDAWGLVSEVSIVEQCTTVILQSFLKVVNQFNEPIHIHALADNGGVAEFIGTVEGNSSFSLPIHACYKMYKNLFFSVRGYALSTEPFPWDELRHELELSLLLQCTSKAPEDQDPFFIEAFGETEQIYYAETKRKTMTCLLLKINLQPTVKIFNSLPVALEICCQGSAHERTLQPGNHAQITNAEPGASTITLRISDYLEKEWSCKETFLLDPEEFLIWKFVSYNGLTPETLNLGVHVTFSKRTAVYSIYSPYFMVNKTGHLLSYKFEQSTTVFYHPGNLNMPVMFSPTSKKFYGKKAATLQVEQSSWSDKFPVDVAGSGGTIECRDMDSGFTYKVSVNITLTYNSLTKMVVFTPFYVLVNSLDFSIECEECSATNPTWLEIPAKSYVPFWPQIVESDSSISIRPKGSKTKSPPFAYHSTDDCLLRLNHECGGIFVKIKATQSGTCITFRPYERGQAPALIVNHSEEEIELFEEGTDFSMTLAPFQEVMFAWNCPTGQRKLVFYDANHSKEVIPLDEDVYGIIYTAERDTIQYVSFLNGPQRMLVFSEDNSLLKSLSSSRLPTTGIEVICKIRGVGISLVNNITQVEIMYMELLSSDVSWEMKRHEKNQYKPVKKEEALQIENAYQNFLDAKESSMRVNVNPVTSVHDKLTVDFEKMEMTIAGKPTVKQLKRMYEPGLWIAFRQIEEQTMLHVKINKIQVDSQLHECVFPVVLAVIPPPKSVTLQDPKPFLEMSVVRVAERNGVDQYKYFKTLIQEFHVKLDIAFIQQVYMFLAAEVMSDEQHKAQFKKNLAFTANDLKDHIEVVSVNEKKNFFELLHFPPLKIHFSFSLAGKLESGDHLPPSLSVLLQSLGVTLTDVHDVVFRLSYLDRKNVFLTRQELQKEVVSHYFGQTIRQAYVLLLGLDVIGNPYGLIVGIGEGVEAFFYEPFQGMIQGPSEFGKGMAIGCRSLFGHTVGSAAGTLGKLTETLGKGLAVLSLDREYQMQRMVEQNRQDNIQASMARGGRGLVMGVVEGVSGVVQKPLQGAKEEGVGGFFKGMGKGLMGLMTRPVTGVVDFASTSFNAVKRVTVLGSENKRLRPPRYFRDDNLVEPYNLREAQGNLIFYAINKGKYCKTDKYEYHLYLREREIIVLTNKRLILAEHSDVFGTWQEHMAITWRSMPDRPHCHTKGVALSIPPRSGSGKHERPDIKVLLIEDDAIKMAICKKMEEFYHLEKECGECPFPS